MCWPESLKRNETVKKFLKFFFGVLGAVLLFGIIWLWSMNEEMPQGEKGHQADKLAHMMLVSLNYDTYKKTRYLEWSYRNGANQYVWDKQMGKVEVKWKDYMVNLNLSNPNRSSVLENGNLVKTERKTELIEKALKNFNNDSFWLVGPYKVFDEGTERSLVSLKNGTNALLVTYNSGGSTPGDSYLWMLNENGFPSSFKMWVGIIPVGGLEATWDDWLVTQSGAYLPKSHKLGPLTLDMGAVKGYN